MTSNTFAERIAILGTLLTYAVLMGGMFFILLALFLARGPAINPLYELRRQVDGGPGVRLLASCCMAAEGSNGN